MKKLYSVKVKDEVYYLNIEAEDEKEAEVIALEWFSERQPFVMVEEQKEVI